MYRIALLWLCLIVLPAGAALAKDKGAPKKAPAAKQLSGMSIVGNDEVPKALYIVPWKRSEMGEQAALKMMLNESAVPVDREEFSRQLDLYEVSTGK